MEEDKTIKDTLKEEVEKVLCDISEQGVDESNIEFLYKLVDVHKDLCNETYWKEKIENMRYSRGNYGTYGTYGSDDSYGRRMRDSRGRYMESGRNYGARYRGHDYIDNMSDSYGRYEENRGRYGTDESTLKSLDEMLSSVEKFMEHLEKNASSQEEMSMIKETADRISRM